MRTFLLTVFAVCCDVLPHLLALGLLCAALVASFGDVFVGSLAMACAAVAIAILIGCNVIDRRRGASSGHADASGSSTLSLVMHNVFVHNADDRRCAQQLLNAHVDVIIVVESTQRFCDAMDALGATHSHPFRVSNDLSDAANEYAVSFFSKLPLRDARVQFPFVEATIEGVRVLATNLHAPLDPPGFAVRWREQLDLLGAALAVLPSRQPLVVMGDLNSTAHRPAFKRLLRDAALVDAFQHCGKGLHNTFSLAATGCCSSFQAVRLDHALVRDVAIESVDCALELAGSDHKPVRLVLRVK